MRMRPSRPSSIARFMIFLISSRFLPCIRKLYQESVNNVQIAAGYRYPTDAFFMIMRTIEPIMGSLSKNWLPESQ